MAKLHILLFDIDGTLLVATEPKAYRKEINNALIEIFGTAGIVDKVSFAGKTDLQILREALSVTGIRLEDIEAALPAIAERFSAIVERLGEAAFHCCPGINSLLAELSLRSDYLLSILTGNIEPLAWAKLKSAGLATYFSPQGAFGSDAEDRLLLPAIAARRIATALGVEQLAAEQFIIIGDTPHDIACARHFGAQVLAVASGNSTMAELAAAQPDLLFPDLSQTAAVIAALETLKSLW